MKHKRLTSRPAWAFLIEDGQRPPLVPWGCGNYWQLPVFHSREDAETWAKEHSAYHGKRRLVRVDILSA